jgi:amino acid adenylation domain-containing protein
LETTQATTSLDNRAQLAQLLQQRLEKQVHYSLTTPGQQALWVLQCSRPQSSEYNVAFAARLEGPLHADSLQRAVQALVQRHSALRSRFLLRDGALAREVAGFRKVPWEVVDATYWTEAELDGRLANDHRRPFHLDREIPIRAVLYSRAAHQHTLLVDIHHVVFDAWSLWLFAKELIQLYQFELGVGRPLPAPSARFEDYAAAEAKRWVGAEAERELAFWRTQLAGLSNPVAFPPTRCRSDSSGAHGASFRFCIDPDLAAATRQLATELAVTPFTVYLCTMYVALHRYTAQTDLTLGCPCNGRKQHLLDVVGYLVNPVAVRLDVSGDPTFSELVQRLAPRVMSCLEHQDYPFPELVKQLDLPREPGRTPLFQAAFNYYRPQGEAQSLSAAMSSGGLAVGDLRIHQQAIDQQEGQFELVLDLLDTGSEIQAAVKYRSDLYDAGFAERLAGHFTNLLRAAVREPGQSISQLEMLGRAERQRIVEDWNVTLPLETAVKGRLYEPFLAQAARHPEAIAALNGTAQLSYGELLARASGLACRLQALGVVPDSCVGVCLERSFEMLVAVLGVQLAGGAYVPLDVRSPDERSCGILEQAKARVVIARSSRCRALAGSAAHALAIDGLGELTPSERRPEVNVASNNLAYIIFTSGSTGAPKGVMIEHQSALNTILDINQRFSVGPEDRLIGLSALGFDLSVYDIFGALAAGAALVIPEHEKSSDPGHWRDLLCQHRVSIWNSAPIMMEMLTGLLRAQKLQLPAALRLVMLSGDWIPLGLPDAIVRHSAGRPQVISLGGATEAAIWSIGFAIDEIRPEWKSIPYGRPLARQRFHALDAALNPVPVGVVGELYIGGIGVARGYLGRPDLTQERFIPDPFGGPGERLYRTGDLGRYMLDGNIEFLGRIDSQVKIRGYRVELGEIEVCLARHPAVAEAVVLAKELHRGTKDLVAYILPHPVSSQHSSELPIAEINAYLSQLLPDYMLPCAYVAVSHLPMTANGKLDRDALPLPQLARSERERVFVAPRTELEHTLAKLWCEVLEVDTLSVEDDFFDLGGQSWLAVMLLARLGEALRRELPLDALLQARTVAGMARWLEQRHDASDNVIQLRPGTSGTPLFCVHPVGGNVLAYRQFVEHLAEGYPVYAIRAEGLSGGEVPQHDLRTMAKRYVEAIRRIHPNGPYRLCGWSMGGIIALEMATQLASHERVELVTMIDSYAQETTGRVLEEAELLNWMARDIAGMAGSPVDLRASDLGTGGAARRRLIERAVAHGAMPKDVPTEQLQRLCSVLESNLQAMFAHQPRPYAGAALLIHTCDGPDDDPRHALAGWRDLLPNLTAHFVSGNHYTLLEPPAVQRLAHLLDAHLEQLKPAWLRQVFPITLELRRSEA